MVEPKRKKLKESEEQLAIVMGALQKKQAELKEVMDKLAELDADLTVRLLIIYLALCVRISVLGIEDACGCKMTTVPALHNVREETRWEMKWDCPEQTTP